MPPLPGTYRPATKATTTSAALAVKILTSAVVDGRRPRIGVASGDIEDIAERDSRIKGRHDERGSEHVGMDDPEPSPLANRADPPVSSPAIKPLTVLSPEDGSLGALPDREAMSFDVSSGATPRSPGGRSSPSRTTSATPHDPGRTVLPWRGKSKIPVGPFLGPLERVKLGVHRPCCLGLRLPTVDMCEAIKATDRRQPPIDGGGSEVLLFHGSAVQLDVGAGRFEDCQMGVGCPLEKCAEVVSVGVQSSAADLQEPERPQPPSGKRQIGGPR